MSFIGARVRSQKVGKDYDKITDTIRKYVARALENQSEHEAGFIVDRYMSGGRRDALKRRSGRLAGTTRGLSTRINDNTVTSGIAFGTEYASIHISRKPKETVIKPQNAQWLTIPLDPVLTPAGVPRGTARDFDDLFFIKPSDSQHPLLVREDNGEITPYFVLLKEVRIESRVHTDEIFEQRRDHINEAVRQGFIKGVRAL